jgi:hypothetical protein
VNGADFRDDDGTWCSWHTLDGRDATTYPCPRCGDHFHPDTLDAEGFCSYCAQTVGEYEDQNLWRGSNGDYRIV